ncbi:hypothetical protein V6N13_040233 [Hibiscus sabdariffa]
MAGEQLVELKFRLADGTDIGPNKYGPDTTVASPKEKILAHWPRGYPFTSVLLLLANEIPRLFADKENCPKTIQDVKLINAGKILENNKTLAESRLPVGELPEDLLRLLSFIFTCLRNILRLLPAAET